MQKIVAYGTLSNHKTKPSPSVANSTPPSLAASRRGAGKRHHWERPSASQGWHGGTHGWGSKKDERVVTSPKKRKH